LVRTGEGAQVVKLVGAVAQLVPGLGAVVVDGLNVPDIAVRRDTETHPQYQAQDRATPWMHEVNPPRDDTTSAKKTPRRSRPAARTSGSSGCASPRPSP